MWTPVLRPSATYQLSCTRVACKKISKATNERRRKWHCPIFRFSRLPYQYGRFSRSYCMSSRRGRPQFTRDFCWPYKYFCSEDLGQRRRPFSAVLPRKVVCWPPSGLTLAISVLELSIRSARHFSLSGWFRSSSRMLRSSNGSEVLTNDVAGPMFMLSTTVRTL